MAAYLWGEPGAGKSWAAAAWLVSRVRRAESLWIDAREWVELSRANTAGALTRAGSIKRAPLLVLDDLGTEARSDYARSVMTGLVDYRLDGARGNTVITSNLRPIELKHTYGGS